jgi:hypothetical protein
MNQSLQLQKIRLFNMCRIMDDIAVVGMPDTVDVAAMMGDERDTGGPHSAGRHCAHGC